MTLPVQIRPTGHGQYRLRPRPFDLDCDNFLSMSSKFFVKLSQCFLLGTFQVSQGYCSCKQLHEQPPVAGVPDLASFERLLTHIEWHFEPGEEVFMKGSILYCLQFSGEKKFYKRFIIYQLYLYDLYLLIYHCKVGNM